MNEDYKRRISLSFMELKSRVDGHQANHNIASSKDLSNYVAAHMELAQRDSAFVVFIHANE
jgi:hypothetical protein